MNGIIGEDRFEVGGKYKDAVGRTWRASQKYKVNGQPCMIVYLCTWSNFSRISYCHPAIIEDGGNTATVLLDEGFTTLYAEEEKE